MPRLSMRQQALQDINTLLEFTILDLSDSDEEGEEDIGDLIMLRETIESMRYVVSSSPIPKDSGLRHLLWRYPEPSFRQIVRMDKTSFVRLHSLIQDHPVFRNVSKYKQEKSYYQLMVVLSRLGCNGNGAAIGWYARMAGISHGSVCRFTTRVFKALLDLHGRAISWPNAQERMHISQMFERKYGIPGAVGIVDGTHIIFAQKPHVDGEVYYSRKRLYSINLQLVCDDNKIIRFYQTGWPGSVFDSTVFDESHVCKNPAIFFSPSQFILADSGYAGKSFVCTPYKNPQALIPHNQLFNKLFSSARVLIEHLNGILKARFSSLRGLRTQVKKRSDYDKINKWIVVCLILHNLMIEFQDKEWPTEDEDIDDIYQQGLHVHGNVNNFVESGNELRLRVQNTLLEW